MKKKVTTHASTKKKNSVKKKRSRSRKQALVQENTHATTKKRTRSRKHALDQESVHEKKNSFQEETITAKKVTKKPLIYFIICFILFQGCTFFRGQIKDGFWLAQQNKQNLFWGKNHIFSRGKEYHIF